MAYTPPKLRYGRRVLIYADQPMVLKLQAALKLKGLSVSEWFRKKARQEIHACPRFLQSKEEVQWPPPGLSPNRQSIEANVSKRAKRLRKKRAQSKPSQAKPSE